MGYLKSILTYHIPSEAEVDKSMLESHGIIVNLLNANVARAEIGSPFHIQLQVPDEQVEEAVMILKELRPERFGSAAVVKEIEAGILRAMGRFALMCLGCTVVLFCFFIDEPSFGQRLVISLILGAFSGGILFVLQGLLRRRSDE